MKKIFTLFMLLVILSFSQLWAFHQYSDSEIVNSPIFQRARFYFDNQVTNKAIEEFQNIINQYPGTAYAAEAQLGLIMVYAMMSPPDSDKIKSEYVKMIQLYPNTRYELIGKLYDTGYHCTSNEDWFNKINVLIVEYGGESIFEIIEDKNRNGYDSARITKQYAEILPEIYLTVSSELEDENRGACF